MHPPARTARQPLCTARPLHHLRGAARPLHLTARPHPRHAAPRKQASQSPRQSRGGRGLRLRLHGI